MPWYPDNDGTFKLVGPKKIKVGANGPVKRIVVHTVGSTNPESTTQAQNGCYGTWMGEKKDSMVSAHFCVERDGRVYQFADTDDIAFGTGWCTGGSIHIEHAGNHPLPLTADQMYYTTKLMAWLATVHPDIRLEVEGTGEADPGDPTKACITCHRFIQVAAKREIKAGRLSPMDITDKACPGTGIMGQLQEIANNARRWKALMGANAAAGISSGLPMTSSP
ncbi:MAG: N-acetylmuramoyl-L-alanine amidase [Alphaproteobacteria bacterium]|nr:N-acetylmuramoyl-L-alanine amidase [Alphaproteobacteria bacterium]